MTISSRLSWLAALAAGLFPLGAAAAEGDRVDLVNRQVLRVCSDPANLPFSNEKLEGFENKIADIVADELKLKVEYTFFPQATGFVRRTLFAKACDLIIGFAQGDELVQNTNHYYRSTYVLLYPKGKGLDGVDTIGDPRLQGKKIGVIGGTPPGDYMAKYNLMGLARGYTLTVDRRFFNPAEDMVTAMRAGELDAGILWGPIGGYAASRGGDALTAVPLLKEKGGPRLTYRITMGVRNGEDVWKRQLNRLIAKRQGDIDKVLLEYGVPLLDEQDQLITAPRPASEPPPEPEAAAGPGSSSGQMSPGGAASGAGTGGSASGAASSAGSDRGNLKLLPPGAGPATGPQPGSALPSGPSSPPQP